jgi:hypothetical protein
MKFVGDASEKILKCLAAAELFYHSDQQLFSCSIVSSSETYLPALEKLLLDLTAYDCTEGVFYCMALQHADYVVVRYHEAGNCKGFMKSQYMQLMSSASAIDASKFLLMMLYTSSDVKERAKSLSDRCQSISSTRLTGNLEILNSNLPIF